MGLFFGDEWDPIEHKTAVFAFLGIMTGFHIFRAFVNRTRSQTVYVLIISDFVDKCSAINNINRVDYNIGNV